MAATRASGPPDSSDRSGKPLASPPIWKTGCGALPGACAPDPPLGTTAAEGAAVWSAGMAPNSPAGLAGTDCETGIRYGGVVDGGGGGSSAGARNAGLGWAAITLAMSKCGGSSAEPETAATDPGQGVLSAGARPWFSMAQA